MNQTQKTLFPAAPKPIQVMHYKQPEWYLNMRLVGNEWPTHIPVFQDALAIFEELGIDLEPVE